jgi:NAD(P)H-hydrate repair Nnr-like enzyme with NAD(P)H-hydrate epimerase domain
MLPVHDELNGESLNRLLDDKFKLVIEESMMKAGKMVCPDVPMGVGTESATYWKH